LGRGVRPDVRTLIVSAGLFSVGYSILIFTIPLFAVTLGSSQSDLGFIALVYNLPSLFVPFVVGSFLNKAKAVRVIQLAVVSYALPILLFPYGSNFLQLAGIRVVQGFAGIAFWVSMEKGLADLAPHGARGRVMGLYNVSWASAFVVGPLIGGFLVDEFSYGTTFVVAFLTQAAALLLLILLRPRESRDTASTQIRNLRSEDSVTPRRWESGNLSAACLTAFVSGGALGVLFSLFPAYATFLGFSAISAGFLILLFSASRMATFLGVGPVTERIGERKFMLMGLLLSISAIGLGLTGRAELLGVTMLVLGVGAGMSYTSGLTLVSHSPRASRGSAIGKYELSLSLGIAVMSQVGGLSADRFGLWTPYVIAGLVALFGSAGLVILYRAQTNRARS
jgi:MFS family permease